MQRINTKFISFSIKLIAVVFIVLLALYSISPVFVPKWNTKEDNYVGTNISGFYAEPKNSIDVLYVGNSSVFCGISPMEIWNEFGLTGYDIAVGSSRPWTEYYMIKNVLREQSPKMIVLNVDCAFDSDETEEVYLRKAYDHINVSSQKMEAIFSEAYHNDGFESLSYIIPTFRYHDRWSELKGDDFRLAYTNNSNVNKGYDLYNEVKPYVGDTDYYNLKDGEVSLSQKSQKYLDLIVELCNKNDINLIFTVIPSTESWNYEKHNVINEYCESNGIQFVDMNTDKMISKIGIDWNNDTCDGGIHLNNSGATKTSKYIGAIISQELGAIKHDDETDNRWNNDYKSYILGKEPS